MSEAEAAADTVCGNGLDCERAPGADVGERQAPGSGCSPEQTPELPAPASRAGKGPGGVEVAAVAAVSLIRRAVRFP